MAAADEVKWRMRSRSARLVHSVSNMCVVTSAASLSRATRNAVSTSSEPKPL